MTLVDEALGVGASPTDPSPRGSGDATPRYHDDARSLEAPTTRAARSDTAAADDTTQEYSGDGGYLEAPATQAARGDS